MPSDPGQYDCFLCHASEDKETIVSSLVDKLAGEGLRVFFDQLSIDLGAGIDQAVANGLRSSEYGLVVISPALLSSARNRPARREIAMLLDLAESGELVLIPILHGVSVEELRQHFPELANTKAALSADGLDAVVQQILRRIKNAHVDRIVRGDAPNGAFVKTNADERCFVIAGGARFWIPNPAILTALGLAWSELLSVPAGTLDQYDRPPRDGTLVVGHAQPEMYLIQSRSRIYVPDESWLAERGIGWNPVRIPQAGLDRLPLARGES